MTDELGPAARFGVRDRPGERSRRARVELTEKSGVSVNVQDGARIAACSGADLPRLSVEQAGMHALLLAALLQAPQIDSTIRMEMRMQNVAGLSIGIARNGRTLYEHGYGISNFARNTRAQGDTVYRIGSLTKPFTAYAVQQLAAGGKLSLGDRVSSYITLPWTEPITIDDLLRQRSGIPNYADIDMLSQSATYAPEALVDAVARLPLHFAPGTQFEYSNTNYILLGEIIERAARMPYDRYLQTAILTPLGLHHTRYGDQPEEARGYARDTLRTPVTPSSVSYAYAAAAMSSNVPDLLRWLDSAAQPYDGYRLTQIDGYEVHYAPGNVPGYSALEAILPKTGDRIVILTNADRFDLMPLTVSVIEALEPPTPQYRVRMLVEQLQAATLVRSALTPAFNARLSNEQLHVWQTQLAPLGSVSDVEQLSRESMRACTKERFRVTFSTNARIGVEICSTPSGAIDGISISQQ